MFCAKCGAQVSDGAKFCDKCGAPVGASQAQGQSVPQAHAAAANGTSPWDYYVGVWRKYVEFGGRARRAEYWYFVLFNFLAAIALSIVDSVLFGARQYDDTPGLLTNLYNLAVFLPSIAVGIRRLHDSNHRGWWLLLPIVNIIFLIIDGTPGPNRFGADPKGRTA